MRHKKYIRRLAPLLTGLLLGLNPAANANHDVFQEKGIMLDGYDVVAYHTLGKAKRGSEEFQTDWLGGKWLFISQRHRVIEHPITVQPRQGGTSTISTMTALETVKELFNIVDFTA